MKKLFFLLVFFTFISFGFSQKNETKKEKIITLLEINDNSKLFTELVSLNINKITKNKQASFRSEMQELARKKKKEAIIFFMKKYSMREIDAIYLDYSVPNRLSYSQKTLSFLREWKTYKLLYQKEFKISFANYFK